jgi:Metallo-peptidase family M12B Reprolysin-like
VNTKRGLLSLFAIILPFSAAFGTVEEPAILIQPTEREGTVRRAPNPAIVLQRNILIDLAAFRAPDNERFVLPLFDGVAIVLVRDRRETPRKENLVWYGHVENQPGSMAVFSNVGEAMAANVITRSPEGSAGFYHIRYLGNGVHVLRQLDPSKFLAESSPDEPEEPEEGGGGPCTTDSGSVIDALVVYTDDAQAAAGGSNGIESVIGEAVGWANTSYSNSAVSQRLHLAATAKVSYTESGDPVKDRRRLRSKNDGFMDSVHQLRDAHGADVVVLIVNNLSSCGKSYIMNTVSPSFESKAFAVVKLDYCAADNYSLAHELGHIMGARHEWEKDPKTGKDSNGNPILYNHGYVLRTPASPGEPWRTIMATDEGCKPTNCTKRLPYWSNPAVPSPEGGDPMGVATGSKQSDDHKRLNDTAKTVANFRCSKD